MKIMKALKIVYIEDDEKDVFLFYQHIKRVPSYNIELIPIINIENEIDKIFNMDFDIIFLDYILKNTTGMEVLSVLRSFGIKVPIILLTDIPMDSNTHNRLKSLGSSDYIQKSNFNAETLEKIIRNYKTSDKYKPINTDYKMININRLLFFHSDGRLIYSSIVTNGELKLYNEELNSPTLFSASLYIINTYMRETTGSEFPFHEMISNDMYITYDKGETIGMCVISENSCNDIRHIFREIIVGIENEYGGVLKNWNGNIQSLDFQPYIMKLQSFVDLNRSSQCL